MKTEEDYKKLLHKFNIKEKEIKECQDYITKLETPKVIPLNQGRNVYVIKLRDKIVKCYILESGDHVADHGTELEIITKEEFEKGSVNIIEKL